MDKATAAIYDEVAADWQRSRGEANDDLGRRCREGTGDGLVIDLGCGPGRYLGQLAAPVIGVDISASMLGLVRRQGHPLVQADLEALPFRDSMFAGAFARHSYLHLSRAQAATALAELTRVLRPGGYLVLSLIEGTYQGHDLPGDDFPGRYYAFWTGHDLEAALHAAGFAGIEVARVSRRKGGADLLATGRGPLV
jgi:SAM-dependent methyltransferase